MLAEQDVLAVVEMLKSEHLDVRAVTLGVNLFDLPKADARQFTDALRARIIAQAGTLAAVCDEVGERFGVPVVNKRVAVSPIALAAAGFSDREMVGIALALDEAAVETGIDFIGGFTALVEKGMSRGDLALIEATPEALARTRRLCASFNLASTKAGVNMDAVLMLARTVKAAAEATAEADGVGAAKLGVFANIPQDVPFMAGAHLGVGEGQSVINVGVSGPGVVKRALERALVANPDASLGELAEVIKRTACKVTRVGELIGREAARRLGVDFGVADVSLAPTPTVGDSVGEIFHALGLGRIGAPGTTAALMLLTDAVKKGGCFASSFVGGYSGAFIPVSEDAAMAQAAAEGSLTLAKLEAMTSVCSVGLDMVVLPGSTGVETLAGIMADELAIGVVNNKTTAARLIPVPGKGPGETAVFGGLLGEAWIMDAPLEGSAGFVKLGGRIPAPMRGMTN